MTTPTDPDLALAQRARELADAATPGPWEASLRSVYGTTCVRSSNNKTRVVQWKIGEYSGKYTNKVIAQDVRNADAAFIAAARSLVPNLAAAVERLVQERDALQVRLDNALEMVDRRWR